MNTLALSIHHLSAIWPRIRARSITTAIGTVLGLLLIWVNLPGSRLVELLCSLLGRWVLALTWGWLACSVIAMICRDRLGDQFQFFQTRPVSRTLRISVSVGAAFFTVLLLAVSPVLVGAWLYNFPSGWQAIAESWAIGGTVLFLPLLALIWSRSRDGWVASRVLLSVLGIFLSYAIFLELRAWIPKVAFPIRGTVPRWLPVVVLGAGSLWLLFLSLRRHSGLPRIAFVAFGVVISSSVALLALTRPSPVNGESEPRPPTDKWASALVRSEATVLGWAKANRAAISFSLPEFSGKDRMIGVEFSGRITSDEKMPNGVIGKVTGMVAVTRDPLSLTVSFKEMPLASRWFAVPDSQTFLPLAKSLNLGEKEPGNTSSNTEITSDRIHVTLGGDWPDATWLDNPESPTSLAREVFLDGHLVIYYRKIQGIFRGPSDRKLKARSPGTRLSVSPLIADEDRKIASLRARILHSDPIAEWRSEDGSTSSNLFTAVIVSPSDIGPSWMSFPIRKASGGAWISPHGSVFRIDRSVYLPEPLSLVDWLEGCETIVLSESEARSISLPVRLPLRIAENPIVETPPKRRLPNSN